MPTPWPIHSYPWPDLLSFLESQVIDHLPLVAYGSLVNAGSAAVTLKETSIAPIPIRAYGCQRVFHYSMAMEMSRYAPSENQKECAALNVVPAPGHYINGILMQIQFSDLEAFRNREADYDLIPVEWEPFEKPDSVRQPAYILSCRPGHHSATRIRNDILPNPDYLKICRAGADSFGAEFRKCWEETTYMADGRLMNDVG